MMKNIEDGGMINGLNISEESSINIDDEAVALSESHDNSDESLYD
jgi:hypothetical protein